MRITYAQHFILLYLMLLILLDLFHFIYYFLLYVFTLQGMLFLVYSVVSYEESFGPSLLQ